MRVRAALEEWHSLICKLQTLLESGAYLQLLKALLNCKAYLEKNSELDGELFQYEIDIKPLLIAAKKLDELAKAKEFRFFLCFEIVNPIKAWVNEHTNPDCSQDTSTFIINNLPDGNDAPITHASLFQYLNKGFEGYIHKDPTDACPKEELRPYGRLAELLKEYIQYQQGLHKKTYDIASLIYMLIHYWLLLKVSSNEHFKKCDIKPILLLGEDILSLSFEGDSHFQEKFRQLILLLYSILYDHPAIKSFNTGQFLENGFSSSLISSNFSPEQKIENNFLSPLIKDYKKKLKKSRAVFEEGYVSPEEAQRLHTTSVLSFFKKMISAVMDVLGKPPCELEICILGSTSRFDRRPYSDIELMILHGESSRQAHVDVYIYHFFSLLELMMYRLGETPPKTLSGAKKFKVGGFRIDSSTYVLAQKNWGTPIELSERFVTKLRADEKFPHAWLNPELCAMLNPLVIYPENPNQNSLFQQYQSHCDSYLSARINSESDNMGALIQELHLAEGSRLQGFTRRQGIAMAVFWDILEQSKNNKIKSISLNSTIDIKNVYYKPLAYFAVSLNLYYSLQADSPYTIFETMKNRCTLGGQVMISLLQSALNFIASQQIKLHRENGFQEEVMPYPRAGDDISEDEQLFWAGADLITQGIILPLKEAIVAWMKSPSEEFFVVLDRASKHARNREFLYQWYCIWEKKGLDTEAITMLPDAAGFRIKERLLAEKLDIGISALKNTTEEMPTGLPLVKIKRVTARGEEVFDLDSGVVKAIINAKTGHIKRHQDIEISPNAYEHRAVNYIESLPLHFKEHPDRPLMSVFSHLLHMRIFGSGSTPVESVLFEVTLQNKEKMYYPVLISLTVPGPTLESKLGNLPKLNLPRVAANLIMDAITHNGDGFARNSILNGDPENSECVCVDSEQIFVNSENEPGFMRSREIQEVSIYYCLPIFRKGGELADNLPRETLEALAHLDVELVLNECLDSLAEREQLDRQVYGKHLPSFIQRSKEHPFVGDALFEEGMIGKLALELRTLKALANKGKLNAFDVLTVCAGRTCANEYFKPTHLSPNEHLKSVAGRAVSQSSGQLEKQCLGASKSYTELRSRKHTIAEVRKEITSYQLLSFSEAEDSKDDEFLPYAKEQTLVLNFSGKRHIDKPQLERLIRANISFMNLIIRNCSVLGDAQLGLLLKNSRDTLKLLSVNGHLEITEDSLIYLSAFPKLEVLLASQTGLRVLSRAFGWPTLLDNLRVLQINSCQGLTQVNIASSQLLYFDCKNNLNLLAITTRTPKLIKLNLDGNNNLKNPKLNVSWIGHIKVKGVHSNCLFTIDYGVEPGSSNKTPMKINVLSGDNVELANSKRLVFKVTLLGYGGGGAGKTCFLRNFLGKDFNPALPATIGASIEFKRVAVSGCFCSLQIFDTSGKNAMEKITSMYTQGARGLILFFDLTESGSCFETLEYFSRVTEGINIKIPIILVGTRSDLIQHREVSFEEAQAVARKIGAPYFEASAKDGTNVEEVFFTLAKMMYSREVLNSQKIDRVQLLKPISMVHVKTMRDESNLEIPKYLFKVVLRGNTPQKTIILDTYRVGRYSNPNHAVTGVEFLTKKLAVNGDICKVQIWDTAEQDRYREVTSLHYKGCHGFILFFDLTERGSLSDESLYIKEVLEANKDQFPVIIVGANADLVNKRAISSKEAQEYADKNQAFYIEASAKEGINVNEIFEILARLIYSKVVLNKPIKVSHLMPKISSQNANTFENNRQLIGAPIPSAASNHAGPKSYDNLFKIVIRGNTIEKSRIREYFENGVPSKNNDLSCNVEFGANLVMINASLCKLQIWDTPETDTLPYGGLFDGCGGIILFFGIYSRDSFLEIFSLFSGILEYSDTRCPIFLVGAESSWNPSNQKIEVSSDEARALAQEMGAFYLEASAKDGKNVNEIFEVMAKMIYLDKAELDAEKYREIKSSVDEFLRREPSDLLDIANLYKEALSCSAKYIRRSTLNVFKKLGKLNSPGILELLRENINHENDEIRKEALAALEQTGAVNIPQAMEAGNQADRLTRVGLFSSSPERTAPINLLESKLINAVSYPFLESQIPIFTDPKSHPPKNSAAQKFIGVVDGNNELNFDQWLSRDSVSVLLPLIVQKGNTGAMTLCALDGAIGVAAYSSQIRKAVQEARKAGKSVLIISKEPVNFASQHYVLTIFHKERMYFIDPTGQVRNGFCKEFNALFAIFFDMREVPFLASRTKLQLDSNGLVSCGVICLALCEFFSEVNNLKKLEEIEHRDEDKKPLQEESTHFLYNEFSLDDTFPSLVPPGAKNYQGSIMAYRAKFYIWLNELEELQVQKLRETDGDLLELIQKADIQKDDFSRQGGPGFH